MDTPTISILIALVGCFVGLGGWLRGRDTKIINDSEWKGAIGAKLDILITSGTNVAADLKNHADRLVAVEASAKQAHKRIDRIEESHDQEKLDNRAR